MSSTTLQNVYLFKTLTPDEMKLVNGLAATENHSAGETIFIRGEPAKLRILALKVYRELAHFMCGRLRSTISDLEFAREKNLHHF